MIRLSKIAKTYIDAVLDKRELAEKLGISYSSLSNILADRTPASNNFIIKFLKETQFDFEKAFIVDGDK